MFVKERFFDIRYIALQNIIRMIESAKIRYEIRSSDFGRPNRGSGLFGNLGENLNKKIMYDVYVRKITIILQNLL